MVRSGPKNPHETVPGATHIRTRSLGQAVPSLENLNGEESDEDISHSLCLRSSGSS
ncbi:unnamed protein product [Dovyalis caffra]|uniref:Uncharacterized protein n=1 Tax=Dovyalis caffra TaxID=77055 RepID=A0AAV1S2D1_9ROSI|nr:unnamed protein product [Dovyalis caffra]